MNDFCNQWPESDVFKLTNVAYVATKACNSFLKILYIKYYLLMVGKLY